MYSTSLDTTVTATFQRKAGVSQNPAELSTGISHIYDLATILMKKTNIEVIDVLGKPKSLIEHMTDRPRQTVCNRLIDTVMCSDIIRDVIKYDVPYG